MLAQLALLEWSAVVVGGHGRVPSRRALDLVGHGGVERGLVAPRLVEEVGDHGLGRVVRDQRPVREDRAGLGRRSVRNGDPKPVLIEGTRHIYI